MLNRFEIKQEAKRQLSANYWLMTGSSIIAALLIGAAAGIVPGIGSLIIVGAIAVGLSLIYLNIRRGLPADFNQLFSGFSSSFGNNFVAGLLVALYTFLWSLLFVIPGIIKSYSYSMTYYILADNPGMDASAAINESIRLTDGHKWELFVLDLSFIGWDILAGMTGGILGIFYVIPYQTACKAAYYEAYRAEKILSSAPSGN